ncbi:LysR family transcriptional regulator [Mesorhizobium sp. ES1-1]|uniref:LysR family transcriptional regulator n=1 Tax=Mesorhizobium sp. ES1-1 TaxID=2876629 RepID=UPI001CCD6D65|nr:LysR family transcriptional regulator [Mesorhizobium sp. ES1-1]MBZ9676148.1 LysR family transcriptional regulator [Mesorhizobium sp. ES1-1]
MQPNPTLDQLQIFVTVAETGSFSAAGRRLNRAQSVISYGIANLESQLGLKLFQREGTREPQLTEFGQAMLEDARRMVSVLQRIRSRVDGHHQGLEAEVALSVDAALPAPVLVRVLKAFEAQFPTVMLRLHIGTLGLIPDHVVSGQADLGIGGLLGDVEVHLTRIGFMSIVLAAAPTHPLALLPGPVAIEDAREHTQLVVTDQSERTKGRDFGVFAYRTWRLTDMRTKHMLMREGLGWGGLPRWLIADDLASGRLVEIDLEPFSETRSPLFAMRRYDTSPKPAAAWLIDRFKRQLRCFNEFEPGEVPEDEPEPATQAS